MLVASGVLGLRAPIASRGYEINVSCGSHVVVLKDYFSSGVNERLRSCKFRAYIGPFNALCGPVSVLGDIRELVDNEPFKPRSYIQVKTNSRE